MDKEYYQLNLQHAIGGWETSYPLKLKIGDSQYMDLNTESIPLIIKALETVLHIEKIKLEGKK